MFFILIFFINIQKTFIKECKITVSLTYLRRLEVAELKEEYMPMVFNMKKQYQLLSFLELVLWDNSNIFF